jgi:predicted metalloprotease with PDZ domain
MEEIGERASAAYSIGLKLTAEGNVVDVSPDMPAAKAGIGPGMKITAVNGRQFTPDVLRDAIHNAKNSGSLELLVLNGKRFSTYKLDYRDGEKYPVLERNGQPALLDQILKPLTR